MSNIIERLLNSIKADRAPHAILITGPEGCGSHIAARKAAALYCGVDESALINCPDYLELGPKSIGVDEIRQMHQSLSTRPVGMHRAIVINGAHSMTESSQNALLKTLEGPPENTMFLLAGNADRLLQTIRSRCTILHMPEEDVNKLATRLIEKGVPSTRANLAANMSGGALTLSERLACEEYESFFLEAAKLLNSVLTSTLPPYAQATLLLSAQAVSSVDETLTKTEQRRQSGMLLVQIWLKVMEHALFMSLGLTRPMFSAALNKPAATLSHFTTSQIQGIIKKILNAERRMGVANPQLVMDVLLTDICAAALKSESDYI